MITPTYIGQPLTGEIMFSLNVEDRNDSSEEVFIERDNRTAEEMKADNKENAQVDEFIENN